MGSIKNLEIKIQEANESYRNGKPVMSDTEYDLLIDQLKQVSPESPLLKRGIIETVSKVNRKERLPIPMYSLEKVKTIQELVSWASRRQEISGEKVLILTPKMDGISLVVDEINRKAWTRGDGEFGMNSSSHIAKFRGELCSLDLDGFVTFGEAIMSKGNFGRFDADFATARNMVAGLMNRDEVSDDLQYVDYVRYGLSDSMDKKDQLDILNEINSWKIPYAIISSNQIHSTNFDLLYKQWSEEYNIDGIVVEFNDADVRSKLGREVNMNPAYAVAYKNPKWSKSVNVTVRGVSWEVSKDGKLKPVINIEDTEYNGITIKNVTGYNAAYIFDNNIAKGSVIEITRSGDIIPKHLNTVSFIEEEVRGLADEIVSCPSCGEVTRWDETMTEIVCVNEYCRDRRINTLVHFFTIVGVENFGKPSIEQLYDAGYTDVDTMLDVRVDDLTILPGWGEKSAQQLVGEFDKLLGTEFPLSRILHALNVFDGKIGEKDCQLILDNLFSDCEENTLNKFECIILRSQQLTLNDLTKIKGVGTVTGSVFLKSFKVGMYNDASLIRSLKFYVCRQQIQANSNILNGVSVCMTGFRDTELEDLIARNGGKISSGVSKGLTYLIAKDKGSGSSKIVKANSLGVRVVTPEEFYSILHTKGL